MAYDLSTTNTFNLKAYEKESFYPGAHLFVHSLDI